MKYFKPTFTALLILGFIASPSLAKEHKSQNNEVQLQEKWQAEKQQADIKLLSQRATFLQIENLIRNAAKTKQLYANQTLFLRLIDTLGGYPLQLDALANYFDSYAKSVTSETPAEEVQAQREKMEELIKKRADHFLAAKLKQSVFTLLINANQNQALVDFAKVNKPQTLANQIAVLNAELALAKNLKPEEAPKAESAILERYQNLWLNNAKLPDDAQLWAAWYAKGGRNQMNIYQKAQLLFSQNDAKGLEGLGQELAHVDGAKEDEQVASNLALYQDLLKNPANLKSLAEKLPLIDGNTNKITNQFAVVMGFSRYLKTLPEEMPEPSFIPYEQWAKDWQLSEEQIRDWKIAFISRFFDNETPAFQQWRDNEILRLGADNLTERRLRQAILQQGDLTPWLSILSSEGKAKQEWRYWLAKSNVQTRDKHLADLAKEQGFYPMLAAAQLGKPYVVDFPTIEAGVYPARYKEQLGEIQELRALDRLGAAKQRWRFLLENLPEEHKRQAQLALGTYANTQQWFELGVDASIMAKGWKYLALRLPNAYEEYFNAATDDAIVADNTALAPAVVAPIFKDFGVTKTFAMAIARQESAWNPMAQSSANARGLMQLLPSTAQKTAENQGIPYSGETDLFKPLNNILLGTAHLSELHAQYPNNRILIASAYNAGASRVEKWLARANGKLAMDEFIASIPFYETRGYVQNVLTYDYYYQLLQQKEKPQTFSQAEFDRLY